MESRADAGISGSSPLVRGQLQQSRVTAACPRIIPARAGPTFSSRMVMDGVYGSSPLVRGQLLPYVSLTCRTRIIPARAGPTAPHTRRPSKATDHPRSCGANPLTTSSKSFSSGSSPLVRGQRQHGRLGHQRFRIIPARAGPTEVCGVSVSVYQDHPRSCGANSLILRGKSGLSQIKIFDYSSGIWQ